MEINKELLDNHLNIKILKDIFKKCNGIQLVGGAVIDILSGKEPKDYDLINYIPSIYDRYLIEAGFLFQYETKTARTWIKDKIIIQTLKTNLNNFDFTISQSSYDLREGTLKIDEISYSNKVLIPTPSAFEDKHLARNTLNRIKHWKSKGYKIHYKTLNSLKRVAKIALIDRIINFLKFENKES